MRTRSLLAIIFISVSLNVYAQKVGLVLSGGGAKGLAHIGVIKALEENGIPIDYIAGTSMGAIVGSLYAAGYSPEEMEKIVTSENFQNWAWGKIPDDYVFYFKRKENDASWIDLKFKYDSIFAPSLPTNLIPPHAMDLAFMQLLSQAAAKADYSFDSLFVPFRCVASDVHANEPIVFSDGDLSSAVRASMTFPFYFKPITIKGSLLFDGGIYDNFPIDVMMKDFKPDYVIGSCVASNSLPPSEDNILLQIENMIVSNSNYNVPDSIGILIQPDVKMVRLMDFQLAPDLIKIGYGAAMAQMHRIKQLIPVRTDSAQVNTQRQSFKNGFKPLKFKNIYISGLTYHQSLYVLKNRKHKNDSISFDMFKKEYFKLVADDQIESIFPRARYNENTGFYNLFLNVTREKPFTARIGGLISSDNLNTGFLGAEYKYLRQMALSLYGNLFFGKLYSSLYSRIRLDFSQCCYWQTFVSLNRFDYFRGSSFLFYEDNRPLYIVQNEGLVATEFAFPIRHQAKFNMGISGNDFNYSYYQTTSFTQKDTADNTQFRAIVPYIQYERNSLNDKNFPSEGHFLQCGIFYYAGKEYFKAGSTSPIRGDIHSDKNWLLLSFKSQDYIPLGKLFSLGLSGEVKLSNQPLFVNYTSTLLMSSAFQPTIHSKTFYAFQTRNPSYVAAGIQFLTRFTKSIQLRLESYHFEAYNPIVQTSEGFEEKTGTFDGYEQIYSASLVFNTPVTDISFSVNYYPWYKPNWFGQFNIGFLLFNRSMHP
jgi:NTE family protein